MSMLARQIDITVPVYRMSVCVAFDSVEDWSRQHTHTTPYLAPITTIIFNYNPIRGQIVYIFGL